MESERELGRLFDRLGAGDRLPADWEVETRPAPVGYCAAVWALPAHHVLGGSVGRDWLRAHLPTPPRSLMTADFLTALAAEVKGVPGELDLLLVSTRPAQPGVVPPELSIATTSQHPRLQRSQHHRRDVLSYQTTGGVLSLGRGIGGRMETAIEVDPARRGHGLGRLLAASVHVLSDAPMVWAQVTPGNTSSLRAFLAAGYRPVGAEVLFDPR